MNMDALKELILTEIEASQGKDGIPDLRATVEEHPEFWDEFADAASAAFAAKMTNLMAPRWEAAPKGYVCPVCGKEALERSTHFMGGPYSGSVHCTGCDHRESVVSYVGRNLLTVEPMAEETV